MRNFIYILFIILASCSDKIGQNKGVDLDDLYRLNALDKKLPKPQPGDWLHEHHESGQTFMKYKQSRPISPNDSQKVIYLQPIGELTRVQDSIVLATAEYLHIFFALEVKILDPISDSLIPKESRRIREDGHEQIHTKFILDSLLEKRIPSDAIVVMAVTNIDLYPKPSWNFVFGEAYTKKRIGVSSMCRYYQDAQNGSLCLSRLIKTSSHEIGHMFTMMHCTNAICVMNGTNSMEEADSRPNRLCSECLIKWSWNWKYDNVTRMEQLIAYFAKYKMFRDRALIKADVNLLKTH